MACRFDINIYFWLFWIINKLDIFTLFYYALKIIMKTSNYIYICFTVAFSLALVSVGEIKLSPKEVVQNWTQVYGKDLLKAAYLTTLNFRNDQSEEDWAFRYSNIIRQIKYEHLGGEIIDELTKEDKSRLTGKDHDCRRWYETKGTLSFKKG